MENNDKPYTLRLTEQQYNLLRHLWGSIHREFIDDVGSDSLWRQWSIDMQQSMRQAEIERGQSICIDCGHNQAEKGSPYCFWCDTYLPSDEPKARK